MTRAIKWVAFCLTVQRCCLISWHLLSQPWLFCLGWRPRCDCSHRHLYTPSPCTEEEGKQTNSLFVGTKRVVEDICCLSRAAGQTDVFPLPTSFTALLKHTNMHAHASAACFLALVYSALAPYHSWRVAVSTP